VFPKDELCELNYPRTRANQLVPKFPFFIKPEHASTVIKEIPQNTSPDLDKAQLRKQFLSD